MPTLRAEPKVGIGVIIIRNDGKILIGKRKGSHAPYWSIPGGHLDLGESFEQAAIREIYEGWLWVNPTELPQPHFEASEQSIACYLQKVCYIPQQE